MLLCRGEEGRPVHIEIWDWNRTQKHSLIGECDTSYADIHRAFQDEHPLALQPFFGFSVFRFGDFLTFNFCLYFLVFMNFEIFYFSICRSVDFGPCFFDFQILDLSFFVDPCILKQQTTKNITSDIEESNIKTIGIIENIEKSKLERSN